MSEVDAILQTYEKSQPRRLAHWQCSLILLQQAVKDDFAERDYFYDSIWYPWLERIRQGHEVEKKKIEKRYDEYKDKDKGIAAELAVEDFDKSRTVTASMHSALIVAMWAKMESFYKNLIRACQFAHQETKQINSKIGEWKKAILRLANVKIELCNQYAMVDAIRILNNSFKHNDGHYVPDITKDHTKIKQELLDSWNILGDRNEIDYEKLPLEELTYACREFCLDLIEKVQPFLKTVLQPPKP